MRRPAPHRPPTRRQLLLAAAACSPWAEGQAQAAFPSRPITLVVPFGPGGIADLTARAVAQAMQASLGQAVVVDNRPSAGSIVASQLVANAAPDGHTLLLMSNGHAVASGLFKKLPFDAQKDFAPIAALASFDLAVFVSVTSRFRHLTDVLGEARDKPGKLTIGTIAVGSTQHLAAELLRHSAALDVLMVPYKSTPAVLQALRAGEVDMAVEILGPWLPQVQANAVRPLAVSGAQRFADLPEVPTVREAGGNALRGYDVASWNALAAPAKTPPEVLARLNQAANDALRQPAVLQQLKALGVRPSGGTADGLRRLLSTETQRWGAVMRQANIEPQ